MELKNYIKLKKKSPFYYYYSYIDTVDHIRNVII